MQPLNICDRNIDRQFGFPKNSYQCDHTVRLVLKINHQYNQNLKYLLILCSFFLRGEKNLVDTYIERRTVELEFSRIWESYLALTSIEKLNVSSPKQECTKKNIR